MSDTRDASKQDAPADDASSEAITKGNIAFPAGVSLPPVKLPPQSGMPAKKDNNGEKKG